MFLDEGITNSVIMKIGVAHDNEKNIFKEIL